MATSLTTHQAATRSTVAAKAVMAISGLLLVGFLVVHMLGNLKLLLPDDGEEFNAYSHWLREFGYPALPHEVFLWIARIGLVVLIAAHMIAAFKLRARKVANVGAGKRYQRTARTQKSFAARTMVWGGIIVILFVVVHLLQFTAEVLRFGYPDPTRPLPPYDRVLAGFGEWWVVAFYLIAIAAVCLHLRHGVWSAFATLGANTSATARRVLNAVAWLVSAALFVGFMVPPVLILFGVIGR